MLNIYLLTGNKNGYDTYSDCVVVAESEVKARLIAPNGIVFEDEDEFYNAYENRAWCDSVDNVVVKLIGIAHADLEENTVIISSFHAG